MALSPQERSRRMRLNMLMAMSYAVAGRSTFTPLSLFSAGEVGAWYDPSDFSTMFQDSAGTTPVTAVEQPVGLILDKSKGLALGSELIVNGDFSSASSWTVGTNWAVSGGGAVATAAVYNVNNISQNVTLVSGATYKLTFNITSYSAGSLRLDIPGVQSIITGGVTATGSYTYYFLAGAGGSRELRFTGSTGGGFSGTIDNISVKEIAGNHASQTTSTSRPVLSARVNLLTYSEQFNNAAWTTYSASVSANAGAAPDGSTTADALIEAAATATHGIYTTSMDTQTATSWTISCCVKNYSGSRYIQILGAQFAGQHLAGIVLNSSGVYQNSVTGGSIGTNLSVSSYSITDLGNGWVRATVTIAAATAARVSLQIGLANATTYSPSYLGDGTSGFLLWGADVRPANQSVGLPPYQRVAASTDYDTTGFPYYLKFDGTDDFLVTGTINPGSVDKAQVFAGVRKLSDAAIGILAETSTNSASGGNPGSFYFAAPLRTGASGNYAFFPSGSVVGVQAAESAAFLAPVTNIVSGYADISGDSKIIRVNGLQSGNDTGDQGTGNFGSYPLYIGRRGGATLPFNGNLYGLIVRFSAANLPDADIVKAETWVNGKTGAY